MSLKSGIIKILEQPKVLTVLSRNAKIAYYDLLFAQELNSNQDFSTFVDVGSASGEYTTLFKKMYPKATVYSFEPIPERHTVEKGYEPQEMALWNENREIDFNIAEDPRNSSLLQVGSLEKIKTVTAKRFDSLGILIEGKALLKIDVEGAEKEVLEGFGKELTKFDVVLLEFNMGKEYRPSEIMRLMESYGFYRFVQKDLRADVRQSNMFFLRE